MEEEQKLFWRKLRIQEPLPWYREPKYKGNLTEKQKRILDSFRSQEQHPAAEYQSLPIEAQNYISQLETERYDLEQAKLTQACLVLFGLGCYSIYKAMREDYVNWTFFGPNTAFSFIVGVVLLSVPPFYYWRTSKMNVEKFLPNGNWAQNTNEALKREWELEFLAGSDAPHEAP